MPRVPRDDTASRSPLDSEMEEILSRHLEDAQLKESVEPDADWASWAIKAAERAQQSFGDSVDNAEDMFQEVAQAAQQQLFNNGRNGYSPGGFPQRIPSEESPMVCVAHHRSDRSELYLQKGERFVQPLGSSACVAICERVRGWRDGTELEALATPPMEFAVTLPQDHQPGHKLRVPGPHGTMDIVPPILNQPGDTVRYRLAPNPEFQIEVPPGASPGSPVRFERADGVEICVTVPDGLRPGDTFEVTPPVLMVQVPANAVSCDQVIFRHGAGQCVEWYRAQVPAGLTSGSYFAARLPPPDRSGMDGEQGCEHGPPVGACCFGG